MSLAIEQFFPLGRFHATRWRENAFADPFGEWPPSPWRLLRALAARWFQYSRETGCSDDALLCELLRSLAAEPPAYFLPPSAAKGPTVKQYQPVSDQSWSDPSAGSGAVKKAKTTLFPDAYFTLDPSQPVIWQWPALDLEIRHRDLLLELLARVTYFGRAESVSYLRISDRDRQPNCLPLETGGNAPVLCFTKGVDLNFAALLGDSDKEPLIDAPVPPGTEWIYYRRPEPVPARIKARMTTPAPLPWVQFTLGGHVLPTVAQWIKVTERFRGRVLKHFVGATGQPQLLSGKDAQGKPLSGEHDHAFYLIWPDPENEIPSKLIVWRRSGNFEPQEVEAMMAAADRPIPWTNEREGWTAQLVPLPRRLALPADFAARASVWESVTPFVRPHNRHFQRSNGRTRPNERPEAVCATLIEKVWGVRPVHVEKVKAEAPFVKLHETLAMRKARRSNERRTPHVGPGYYLRVTFAEEFQGPLIVGDSSHFGLGVFRAR